MNVGPCPSCKGKRLRPESLNVTIDGFSIADIAEKSIKWNYNFFENIKLNERRRVIAGQF